MPGPSLMPTPIDLPELCLLISKSLSLSDLASCVLVCKNWRNNFGVEFAVRLFAAWRQLDTTTWSEHMATKRAVFLKQRGYASEEELRKQEFYEEPMSPRFRACAHLDPMPRDLVRDFRRFGHLIRKLKVNRAWPFSDPATFCPGLERLHVDVERVPLKRVSRGHALEDEDQYQHLVNQAMVCIAQTHSLQYLYMRVHTHDEVRAVIRWQQESPFDTHPYLPLLTAADICGPVEPSFVDTLLAACPRLRRLSLLGNHPSLHLSYPIAVRSSLEELTISIRQPTWHALHWATKLPHLRQLTVLLKAFTGTSRLPTFHRLTSLTIQEIEQHHPPQEDDSNSGLHAHDGIARLLKAIPVGQLKHLSLQAGGDHAWRALLHEHVLPHVQTSLVTLSLQVGDDESPPSTTGFIPRDFGDGGRRFIALVLEQGAHLQSLKANCCLDATEGLERPWACADTLEHLEVALIYPNDKTVMRRALQRIATCRRLRRLWTTMAMPPPTSPTTPTSPTMNMRGNRSSTLSTMSTSSTSSSSSSLSTTTSMTAAISKVGTAMLDVSVAAGLVQELGPLTQLESISLYWRGPDLVEDRLGEDEAEWMAAHFPNLKEIVGLHLPFCREFYRRLQHLRPGMAFR